MADEPRDAAEALDETELAIEGALRPTSLDEFVGIVRIQEAGLLDLQLLVSGFTARPFLDQPGMRLEAGVPAAVQVRDQQAADPQRPATDIKHPVVLA